jgi:enoyl-CoA hydratase
MNAVIEQMYLDLQRVLADARDREDVRALVLTGSVWKRPGGDKQAFCAGADLKKHSSGDRSGWQRREYIFLAHETTRIIHDLPKPVIAALNGPARGAGAEMALACDFIIMAEEATIGFPETGLGTCVGGGVTKHLPQIVGEAQAKRLIYLGEVLDGRRAVELGLAIESVPLAELETKAREFASRLARKAPLSMALVKSLIQKAPNRDLETVLLAEAEAILACMGTSDWREGIDAFSERREPRFTGR